MNTQDHVQSLEAGQALLLREGTQAAVLTHGAVLVQAPARWLAGMVVVPEPMRYDAPAVLPPDPAFTIVATAPCRVTVQPAAAGVARRWLDAVSGWLRAGRGAAPARVGAVR